MSAAVHARPSRSPKTAANEVQQRVATGSEPSRLLLSGTGSRSQCFCDATFTRDTAGLCQACGPHLVCEGVQTLTVDGETVLQADAVQGQRGGR